MKILFVGGGSVGHIAPSVAVLEAMPPETEAHFVCSRREGDMHFLKSNQLAFTAIDAPRLGLMFPFKFFASCGQAATIINTFKPDIIFSKGGYVSVPLCFVAARKGVPIVLHESDTVSGRANRFVSRWAKHVCLGFPPVAETRESPLRGQRYTGNPIRTSITQGSREAGLKLTGLSGEKPILFVMGGSQGSQPINEIVAKKLSELMEICDILHITGLGKTAHLPVITDHYFRTDFAADILPDLYACASLALTRAGAGSIAELEANNIPTILVPLRSVGHDHQYKNAIAASQNPLFDVVEQSSLHKELVAAVRAILASPPRPESAKNDAARQIAEILLQTLADTAAHQ